MSIQKEYTIIDICHICTIKTELVIEIVEHTIVEPAEPAPEKWLFDDSDLIRIKKALRLHHDLGVNFAGVALALDLYERVESYQSRISHLENLLKQFEK
jgi:chaperone modulatory protein CbpM